MRRLSHEGSPKHVHLLRTSCRRLDVILANTPNHPNKLRQRLRKLRREAAKVRDLDVQLHALATVQLPLVADEQRRVTRRLEGKRARKEKELRDLVAKQRDKVARPIKVVRADTSGASSAASRRYARTALDQFLRAADESRSNDDVAELHDFRLACKKARYLAEMSDPKQARPVIQQLKLIQDAIGDWLDWEMLIASSQKALKNPGTSPLLTALRAQARSRMLNAQRVREEATTRLRELSSSLSREKAQSSASARKPPMRAAAAATLAPTRIS